MGKVFLNDNWDSRYTWLDIEHKSGEGIVYIQDEPYFQIVDFLKRKDSGSLLLSGDRGVGKTTTVLRAIKSQYNLFYINISALQIESLHADDKDASENNTFALFHFLRQLAVRFSKKVNTKGIANRKFKKKINKLLENSAATELLLRSESKRASQLTGEFGLDANISKKLVSAVSKIAGKISQDNLVTKIIEKSGYTIEDFIRDFMDCLHEYEKLDIARVYDDKSLSFKIGDYKIGFLLGKVKDINTKLVFVIDELDYYDKKHASSVLKIIKRFKNLFTLSSAQFIFITGKETYKESFNADEGLNTLFTERVFISKKPGTDLERFLESIVKNKKDIENNKSWDILKWDLISKSNHNYYDLIQEIKSRLVIDNNSIPYLSLIDQDLNEEHSAIHYAVNRFYERQLPRKVIKPIFRETLFSHLIKVENDFVRAIHVSGVSSKVDLEVGGMGADDPQINSIIRSAQITLIRYLFKLGGTSVPTQLEQPDVQDVPIPWRQLSKNFTLEIVRREDISGPVLDAELEFMKLYNGLDADNRLIKATNTTSPTNLSTKLNKIKTLLPVEDSWINAITKTYDSITNTQFAERGPITEVSNAVELLKRAESTIAGRIGIQKNAIYRIDSGTINENGDNKLQLNDKAKLVYLNNLKVDDKFTCTLDVKLDDNGLINLLVFTRLETSDEQDEYYMFRLDTRKSDRNIGDGILLKPHGSAVWNYVDNLETRKPSQPNRWIQIKVVYKNNESIFYKKFVKGKNIRFQRIGKIERQIKPVAFGVLQEVRGVEIGDFSLV